jgi:hypothetical protein
MTMLQTICRRRHAAMIAAALAIVAASVAVAHLGPLPSVANKAVAWTEADWKMPLDNWGQGHAWRATGPGGTEILLYARTKTGFCNCFSGIADDTEIDRIGDVDLHGDNFIATAPGEPTSVGDLQGRKRSFRARNHWSGTRHVLSIVTATDCKAVVATLVSNEVIPPEAEASAVALLTGDTFRRWAADQ